MTTKLLVGWSVLDELCIDLNEREKSPDARWVYDERGKQSDCVPGDRKETQE